MEIGVLRLWSIRARTADSAPRWWTAMSILHGVPHCRSTVHDVPRTHVSQFALMYRVYVECERRMTVIMAEIVAAETGRALPFVVTTMTNLAPGLREDLSDDIDNWDGMVAADEMMRDDDDEDDERETIQ